MSSQAEHFRFYPSAEAVALRLGVTLSDIDSAVEYAASPGAYTERVIMIHGRRRMLLIPSAPLMELQRRILNLLYPLSLELHDSCRGFRPGGSTFANAQPHCGHMWVQKFDIEEFFLNTTRGHVRAALRSAGLAEEVIGRLTNLITTRDALPLGAPTSPAVSNLVLADFDTSMASHAQRLGITYTRYADDMTFSADERFDLEDDVVQRLLGYGYVLNHDKTRLRRRGQKIYVTGLSIAESDVPRLPKQVKRSLRQELHYIELFGFEGHSQRVYSWDFLPDDPDRQRDHSLKHVRGKLVYALGIEPKWTDRLLCTYPNARAAVLGDRPRTQEFRSKHIREVARHIRARTEPRPPAFVDDGRGNDPPR